MYFFAVSDCETQQNLALGNTNTKDKNCCSQEVLSNSESENYDEDEDIALTFCDERNIHHITVDNYVARNNCETEVNSESVHKKAKVPFLHPAAVYYGQPKQVPSQNILKKRKIPARSTTVIGEKLYDNVDDITNKIPDFHPNRNPGNHVPVSQQTCTTFTKPIDFFKIIFYY